MKIPELLEMLKAGVHFGHQSSRKYPKMGKYIHTTRNRINIIDLEKTAETLKQALDFVVEIASKGGAVLFISSKKQAKEAIKKAAGSCGMPYINSRWLGGTFTNFGNIIKLTKKLKELEVKERSGELEKYTKHEQVRIDKELEKKEKNLAGIAHLTSMPDVLFVPALQREKTAVNEANRMGVPIVGVCDTNANPDKAEYVIPANDDAINSIRLVVNLMAQAIKEGRTEYEKKSAAAKVPAEKLKKMPVKEGKDPLANAQGKEKDKRGLDWN